MSIITEMGANLDMLVNIEMPASLALQIDDKVADSMSSRTGHRGLSPLMEREEEEDVDDEGETLLDHNDTSPPKFPSFGTLGKASTSGETNTSNRAGNVLLGDRLDTPELGITRGVAPTGLHVSQLKMDMPLVFSTSRQQNAKG